MANKSISNLEGVHIISHPLVNAKLSVLRQASTSPKEFREGIHDLSFILGFEASRDVKEVNIEGTTPLGATFNGTTISPRIGLTPILRAGLGMTDAMLSLFPSARTYHIGLFREKTSLQPVEYYSKLPRTPTVDLCFLLDPLVATGGTACAAINMILDWGISIRNIKFLVILASRTGLERIHSEFPDLEVWVAGVDVNLTAEGLVSPGLGDTGDRLFNTT
ncbi:UDP-N-acetylglucosamine 1-carboxyvinyltransferase [Ramaria rubella]|nr:UDP-N-acetylglucosamine 1-carboxyvinyltransferase [Ramaria rubella]